MTLLFGSNEVHLFQIMETEFLKNFDFQFTCRDVIEINFFNITPLFRRM